jgi:hypothetical protein
MTAAGPSALHDVDRVDRRGRAWRRRQTRRTELVDALGGEGKLSVHQRQLIELAVSTGALVEDFEAKLAAGKQVNAERFCSAVKLQRRLVADLRLPVSGAPSPLTLSEHLAKRARERASAAVESEAT